jgi:hypothetical protein
MNILEEEKLDEKGILRGKGVCVVWNGPTIKQNMDQDDNHNQTMLQWWGLLFC